ncbi:hypothetical protein [Nannocystis pusilla]|uniref:hypothetical protein n=1 Tax=Nannocystis pusilla TaxID=889268 RepID=UPI003B82012A
MAEWIDREAERVREAADRLDTRDPRALAAALYEGLGPDIADLGSRGEISRAGFVRSILNPNRGLPVTPP